MATGISAPIGTNNSNGNAFAALNGTGAAAAAAAAQDTSNGDRFLKLLVTQMQNQDPLNPMDNAQVTSQIAQINTVNGIEKLNTTVLGLNAQFAQMQAVSGAALVGREVTVSGNRLAVSQGVGAAGFELSASASQVTVEVLNAAGRVLGTVELGPKTAGRHSFEWDAKGIADGTETRFRVIASNPDSNPASNTTGSAAVASTPLMRDRVLAVSTSGNAGLVIDTRHSGSVNYSDVKAFN